MILSIVSFTCHNCIGSMCVIVACVCHHPVLYRNAACCVLPSDVGVVAGAVATREACPEGDPGDLVDVKAEDLRGVMVIDGRDVEG